MTIQEYIKKGNEWIDLKGVPVHDCNSKNVAFIHNHFFKGKELEFQNKIISSWRKICPKHIWEWRVYGGDTPDANRVELPTPAIKNLSVAGIHQRVSLKRLRESSV